jgi:hypothetical protein
MNGNHLYIGMLVTIAAAMAIDLARRERRIRARRVGRLKAIGMEPCDDCGTPLLKRPDCLKGPARCIRCSERRGA